MKSIKAVKDFSLNGIIYEAGEEIEVTNIDDLVRLNEKGFIEPLSAKDLQDFQKPIIKKTIKEEE